MVRINITYEIDPGNLTPSQQDFVLAEKDRAEIVKFVLAEIEGGRGHASIMIEGVNYAKKL